MRDQSRPPVHRRWWLMELVLRRAAGWVMPACVPRPGRIVAVIESTEDDGESTPD